MGSGEQQQKYLCIILTDLILFLAKEKIREDGIYSYIYIYIYIVGGRRSKKGKQAVKVVFEKLKSKKMI